MSKTNLPLHVVFATKNRQRTITLENKSVLYAYINAILEKAGCHVYRTNGTEDHVHILFNLSATEALAPLVKKIKQSSSKWMNGNRLFPKFRGWGEGYYGFAIEYQHVNAAINYIINQEEHHHIVDLIDETKQLAEKNGKEWIEEDWI